MDSITPTKYRRERNWVFAIFMLTMVALYVAVKFEMKWLSIAVLVVDALVVLWVVRFVTHETRSIKKSIE